MLLFCLPVTIFRVERDKSPEEVAKLLSYIIRRVRAKDKEVPILVLEVTYIPKREHLIIKIDVENSALKKVCEQSKNVHFIETNQLFLSSPTTVDKSLFRDDNVHQNAKGYELWSNLIKSEVDEIMQ